MESPKVLVTITSYNRQRSLTNLVAALRDSESQSIIPEIIIFDDCSDWDVESLACTGVQVVRNPEHRGKAGFWRTFNDVFAYCKEHEYDYYIILPDDVSPCPDFIETGIDAYIASGGICISPLLTNYTLLPGKSRWGGRPIERKDGYYVTHYFDCCTICRRDFFEALDWHLLEILPSPNPLRSSGVGKQVTVKLQAQGRKMCHVGRTLLTIVEQDSLLNPEERKIHPMIANWEDNYNCVDVHMASLYREGFVLKTLESIVSQPEVATVYLTLNSYTKPQYDETMAGIKQLVLKYGTRIVTRRAKNQKGSNEKLSQLSKSTAPYIAFADDDIIYKPDHFLRLTHGIRRHNAAAGLHGGRLKRFPIVKYYHGDRQMFAWNITVEEDTKVDILGMGVGMIRRDWFTDAELKDLYDNAPTTSMDDLIISCALSAKGIDRYVVAHQPKSISIKPPHPNDNYVYDQYKDNDREQVEYLNKHLHR